MARGPKKHLKRLNAPHHWMLGKLDGIFAPRPSTGPHKLRECLPVALILRNRLKFALTMQECKQICKERLVKIDGKVRTDATFPAGFQDVVTLQSSSGQRLASFRLMYDTKGRFVLHKLDETAASYKLCRVNRTFVSKKKIPVLVTHDGRTVRYPDPLISANDTVRLDIETGRILEYCKFEVGNVCMITKGKNTGRVGTIVHIERHPGSFDIVSVRDQAGRTFATRLANVFVIGEGDKPWVQLPKGRGVKLSILDERDMVARKTNRR